MLVVSEIIHSNELYFQDRSSKVLKQIETVLDGFVENDGNKLVPPLKKG
jgi:hypothetical protein